MAKSKQLQNSGSHDRSALIQWVALVVVALLGLIAAVVLTDGGRGGGGHSGAPAAVQQSL